MRIDSILTRGNRWRTESHSTVKDRDEEGGVYPSGHYAVLGELALADRR